MLTAKRLLIVEKEALIALDIQRILEDAGAGRVEIARDYVDLLAMESHLARDYDLIVLAPPRDRAEEGALLARLAISGPAVVLCTADLSTRIPVAGLEVVVKPFTDEQLVAACLRTLNPSTEAVRRHLG